VRASSPEGDPAHSRNSAVTARSTTLDGVTMRNPSSTAGREGQGGRATCHRPESIGRTCQRITVVNGMLQSCRSIRARWPSCAPALTFSTGRSTRGFAWSPVQRVLARRDGGLRGARGPLRRGTRALVVFHTIMRRDRYFPNGSRVRHRAYHRPPVSSPAVRRRPHAFRDRPGRLPRPDKVLKRCARSTTR